MAVNQLDSPEHSAELVVQEHFLGERQYRGLAAVDLREARDLVVRALMLVVSAPEPDKCT